MADQGADLRVNTAFRREVADRFGVLPNFFCSADAAPGLIEELWKFARSAYLDSPLPSLFKERLFVHLSRFCRVRYCIVRHVGFLTGLGRPAGDASAPRGNGQSRHRAAAAARSRRQRTFCISCAARKDASQRPIA